MYKSCMLHLTVNADNAEPNLHNFFDWLRRSC